MTTFTNTADEAIAYRDESGKHLVEPGGTFEVVGSPDAWGIPLIPGVVPGRRKAPDKAPDKPADKAEKAKG